MSNGRGRALLFLAVVGGLTYAFWPPDRHDAENVQPPPVLRVSAVKSGVGGELSSIRVNLTPALVQSVEIQVDAPYRVQPVGNDRVLADGVKLAATSVTVTKTGFQIGRRHYPVTRLEIHPRKSPAIWINGHQYRGTVRLYRRPGGKLTAVNVLPLEEYVASVVDSEMPAAFPPEARKSQAVVARTYALYQMGRASRDTLFDVYADTRSQKYLGFQYRGADNRLLAGESAASRKIVDETRGMVCTYGGRLFCTYYSAVCGGHTLRGTELFDDAVPAVEAVPCDFCREAKYYRWNVSLTVSEIEKKLNSVVDGRTNAWGRLLSLENIPPAAPGRLLSFDAKYQHGRYTIRGDRLRSALSANGVRSPHFSVEQQGDYTLHGRGHGHGVGLCQWGAQGQAKLGRSAQQIVQYYYPGAEIVIVGNAVARSSPN